MKKTAFFIFLLLLANPTLFSQEIKTDISAGLSLARGNSESTRFYGKASFTIKKPDINFYFNSSYMYGKGKTGVDTNQGNFQIGSEKLIKGKLKLQSSVSFFYDRLSDIQGRLNFSMGLNYTVEENSDLLSIAASYSEEYENYYTDPISKRTNRLAFQLKMKKALSDTTSFNLDTLYTPNIFNFLQDFRIEGEATLKILMKKPLWLNLTLNERYNNLPSLVTLKKSDIILITSIEIII